MAFHYDTEELGYEIGYTPIARSEAPLKNGQQTKVDQGGVKYWCEVRMPPSAAVTPPQVPVAPAAPAAPAPTDKSPPPAPAGSPAATPATAAAPATTDAPTPPTDDSPPPAPAESSPATPAATDAPATPVAGTPKPIPSAEPSAPSSPTTDAPPPAPPKDAYRDGKERGQPAKGDGYKRGEAYSKRLHRVVAKGGEQSGAHVTITPDLQKTLGAHFERVTDRDELNRAGLPAGSQVYRPKKGDESVPLNESGRLVFPPGSYQALGQAEVWASGDQGKMERRALQLFSDADGKIDFQSLPTVGQLAASPPTSSSPASGAAAAGETSEQEFQKERPEEHRHRQALLQTIGNADEANAVYQLEIASQTGLPGFVSKKGEVISDGETKAREDYYSKRSGEIKGKSKDDLLAEASRNFVAVVAQQGDLNPKQQVALAEHYGLLEPRPAGESPPASLEGVSLQPLTPKAVQAVMTGKVDLPPDPGAQPTAAPSGPAPAELPPPPTVDGSSPAGAAPVAGTTPTAALGPQAMQATQRAQGLLGEAGFGLFNQLYLSRRKGEITGPNAARASQAYYGVVAGTGSDKKDLESWHTQMSRDFVANAAEEAIRSGQGNQPAERLYKQFTGMGLISGDRPKKDATVAQWWNNGNPIGVNYQPMPDNTISELTGGAADRDKKTKPRDQDSDRPSLSAAENQALLSFLQGILQQMMPPWGQIVATFFTQNQQHQNTLAQIYAQAAVGGPRGGGGRQQQA